MMIAKEKMVARTKRRRGGARNPKQLPYLALNLQHQNSLYFSGLNDPDGIK